MRLQWKLLGSILLSLNCMIYSFLQHSIFRPQRFNSIQSNLFPLEKINDNLLTHHQHQIKSNLWNFYLLESQDVYAAAELSTLCFYKPRLVINEKGMPLIEKLFFRSILNGFQFFDKLENTISAYVGIKDRGGNRLVNPNLEISRESVMIVATTKMNPTKIIGFIELGLEMPTGLLPKPFSLPFQPFTPTELLTYQPYLSNLCIDPSERRKGLSRCLCAIVEEIVRSIYQKDTIYLHVERENYPAQYLYYSLGYKTLSLLTEEEIWEHKLHGIVYFQKKLTPPQEEETKNILEEGSGIME